MKKNYIYGLVLSVLGIVFSLQFQSFAYWGPKGTLTMEWYWVGAVLSYIFSLWSFVSLKPYKKINIINIVPLLLGMFSIFWTSFIIIAWNSAM